MSHLIADNVTGRKIASAETVNWAEQMAFVHVDHMLKTLQTQGTAVNVAADVSMLAGSRFGDLKAEQMQKCPLQPVIWLVWCLQMSQLERQTPCA